MKTQQYYRYCISIPNRLIEVDESRMPTNSFASGSTSRHMLPDGRRLASTGSSIRKKHIRSCNTPFQSTESKEGPPEHGVRRAMRVKHARKRNHDCQSARSMSRKSATEPEARASPDRPADDLDGRSTLDYDPIVGHCLASCSIKCK